MKREFLLSAAISAAALLPQGCAVEKEAPANEAAKRYFDAWMAVNYPGLQPSGNGIYIIEDIEGDGEPAGNANYVFVTYTVKDLDGNVTSTSDIEMAKQLGTYNKSYYYGPNVWTNSTYGIHAGVEDMISGMKIGGTRTAVIPSWLRTYSRYENPSDYLDNATSESDAIYKVHVSDTTDDIIRWQIDSLERFSDKYLGGIDSTSYGFYYKQLKEPVDTNSFASDTTIYINYTGRLLNGQVFDTTIADTAKVYNIWDSSKSYEPVEVTWAESHDQITMGSSGSGVISGFSLTLWKMRNKEKAVGVFYSGYGYGSSSSNNMIPAFSPLMFEIEITEKAE